MKRKHLIVIAAVAISLVIYGTTKSSKNKRQSAAAQKALNLAVSFAEKLKENGRKNVEVVRIDGGPNGFPQGYMVTYGSAEKPSFKTFKAIYD